MRKLFWRALLGVLAGTVALAFVAVAALWLANRRDEPLRPEVARALSFSPPAPEAMRRNGYFIMLGLGAPASNDAQAAGERFFAAQMQGYEWLQRTGKIKSFLPAPHPRQRTPPEHLRCDAEVRDCYRHYVAHADAVGAALRARSHLLQRYRQLGDAPLYEEVMPPYVGVEFPYYIDLVAASELQGMQAALLWHAGESAQALALLARNAVIHQRLLAGSRSLIGAMIALAIDMRQQRLISSLLHADPARAVAHALRWQEVLSSAPVDLAPVLAGEMRWSVAALRLGLADWPGSADDAWRLRAQRRLMVVLNRLAYQPHATMNRTYQFKLPSVDLGRQPADRFDAHLAAARRAQQQALEQDDDKGWFDFLRNPLGRALLGMDGADLMQPYIERAHDVNAHRRLVLLQLAALRDGVAPAAMPAWLAAAPASLRNPYTRAPMGWDAATQSLVFEGRQPQTQNPGRSSIYRVRVFEPPGAG